MNQIVNPLALRERWNHLWQRLGAASRPEPVWKQLVEAYTQPHRFYHTLAHIQDCLAQLDWACAAAEGASKVEAALWFHDVVYDPHAADNEEQSAAWAAEMLGEGAMAPAMVDEVHQLILATRHQAPPATADTALVMDIDLSIFGREPAVFDDYEQAIRQEYAWVPEARYRAERLTRLEAFLKRFPLYYTASFCERYASQARKNLARSIAILQDYPHA